ncbi:Ubc6, partial [Symbiodinium sp. CCMP2592]
ADLEVAVPVFHAQSLRTISPGRHSARATVMTTPPNAQRRLLRDFKKVTADAPTGVSAAPVGDDLFKWSAIIFGPSGTAWEGGVWKLDLSFSPEYPQKPPDVRFQTEVFHPNVFPDGQICLDLLKASGWSPAYDVCTILVAIQSLLADPDTHATPEGGANPDAESLFVRDRQGYNSKVQALVQKQLEEDDMGCLSAV